MSDHANTTACPVCGSPASVRVTSGGKFDYEALGDDALVAENQRLRGALEACAASSITSPGEAQLIARAALYGEAP